MRVVRGELFDALRVVEPITLADGSAFEWEFAHPSLLLAEMVGCSPMLQSMYADVANEIRDAPWGADPGL